MVRTELFSPLVVLATENLQGLLGNIIKILKFLNPSILAYCRNKQHSNSRGRQTITNLYKYQHEPKAKQFLCRGYYVIKGMCEDIMICW